MVIFHSYLNLPDGIPDSHPSCTWFFVACFVHHSWKKPEWWEIDPRNQGENYAWQKRNLAFLQEKKPELLPRSWDLLPTGTATKVMAGVASRHHQNHRSDHSPGHIRHPSRLYQSLQLFCLGGLTLFPSFSMALTTTVFPCFYHGFSIFPWFSYDFPMVFPFSPWFSYAFPMVLPGFLPSSSKALDLFKGALDDLTQLRDATCARALVEGGAPPVNCS